MSVQAVNDGVVADVSRQSRQEHLEPKNVLDQKDEQSHAENRQPASDPTSSSSALRCSKSSVFASSATSSALLSELRCCIDRLKSPLQTGHWARMIEKVRW
jgi:hypothetical protein